MTNGFDEERVILDNVNLTIYQGDFITILGGNGAEVNLFNVIAGTLPLTSGSVHILGEDVTNWPAENVLSICHVFSKILKWVQRHG